MRMKALFLIVVLVPLVYSTSSLSKEEMLNQLLSASDLDINSSKFSGLWDKGIWKMVMTNSVADGALAYHKIADIWYYKFEPPYGIEDPVLLDLQKIACTYHLIANITKLTSFEIDPKTVKVIIEVIRIQTEAWIDIYNRTHPKLKEMFKGEQENLPIAQQLEKFSGFFGGKKSLVVERFFAYFVLPIIYNVSMTRLLKPIFEEAKGLNSTEELCQRFFPTMVDVDIGPKDIQSFLYVLCAALEGITSESEENDFYAANKILITFLIHLLGRPNDGDIDPEFRRSIHAYKKALQLL